MLSLDGERRRAGVAVAVYLGVGALWILFSDHLLLLLLGGDTVQLTFAQNIKGLLYILVTGLALYFFLIYIQRQQRRLHTSYQGLLDSADEFFWFADADGSRRHLSDGFESITGVSAEELNKTVWLSLIHPGDVKHFERTRERALREGREYQMVFRLRGREGDYRHIRAHEVPVKNAYGEVAQWIGSCTDISDIRRTEHRLRDEQRSLRLAESVGGISLWHWDTVDNSVHFSNTMAEQLGYKPDKGVGFSPEDFLGLLHPEDRPRVEADIPRVIQGAAPHQESLYRLRHQSGEYRWFLSRMTAVNNEDGELVGVAGANIDITEQKRNQERLRYLAERDDATGFYSRRYLQEALEKQVNDARSKGQSVGLLHIDIDHFKTINDSLGEQVGDRLLLAVGERLRACLQKDDIIARHGGDSFAVILKENPDAAVLEEAAGKILKAFSEPLVVDEQHIYSTLTLGGSLSPAFADDHESLFRQADTAVKEGKLQGRNRFVLFSLDLQERAAQWATYHNALIHALAHDEIYVVFQPQLDVASGRFTVWEALARWRSGTLGDIAPGIFITIAEKSGLIGKLSEIIISKALGELARWHRAGQAQLQLAINISASQLFQPDFSPWLLNEVELAGVSPESVELEVTESVVMRDAEVGAEALNRLAQHGFSIAIDDFGTGYSSLSYLSRLQVDILKIDKSFIQGVLVSEGDAQIVKAVIALAKTLGLPVVAEGVETDEQLAFVRENGCDRIQGFLLSRPIEGQEVLAYLEPDPVH